MALRRVSILLPAETVLTSIVVPKNRRPKFDLHLKIIDLNNVPYVSGKSFVKWHLPSSASAEHRGQTDKYKIHEHRVTYQHSVTIPVRLVIDKNGFLTESWIHFEVLHVPPSAGKEERIPLGNVKLNLAEYVEASEADGVGEEGVCRRYLMQDSKINSTLKISILMKQTEGDRNFTPPPLRTAPVFSGIAGIIAGTDGNDPEDPSSLPAVTSKAREAGDELRELYRKTLAAEWTCQPGELSADKCIEDIFSGGDGWGGPGNKHKSNSRSGSSGAGRRVNIGQVGAAAGVGGGGGGGDDSTGSLSDSNTSSSFHNKTHHHRSHSHTKTGSPWSNNLFPHRRSHHQDLKHHHSRESIARREFHGANRSQEDMHSKGIRGRGSFEQQTRTMGAEADRGMSKMGRRDLEDIDVREDLRSWRIPVEKVREKRRDSLES